MVEFDCEGCGVHVVQLGRDAVPVSCMCAVCEWLCEHIPDPVEMMAARRRMDSRDNAQPEGARLGS
jgi:hypothetical protein